MSIKSSLKKALGISKPKRRRRRRLPPRKKNGEFKKRK